MIGIYKITNLINGQSYIGQSVDIEKRWLKERQSAFNVNNSSYNYPISCAFRKYGIDNFQFEVLEECLRNQLNEREKYWIAQYDTFYNGYNQTLGGDSHIIAPKKAIVGIINDLETTDLYHREIAEKWGVSIEMVQGINTGRYWYQDDKCYPLQTQHKMHSQHKLADGTILKTQKVCIDCGINISSKAMRCPKCANKIRRAVERPNRDKLKKMIRTTPFEQIGQQFGITGNAVRKWCDAYNLPCRVTDIKQYSDEEWESI